MGELSPAVIEAIRMAIQMEEDGRVYYEDAARKTGNALGKKMFESLVRDEVRHLETFQKLFDNLAGTEHWREIAERAPQVGTVPIFGEDVEKKGHANASDLDAIRVAMDSERQSIDHYRKAAEATDDPLAEKIFNTVRVEEEYHYDLLQAQRDYLTRTGFWFDTGEFEMDGMN